MFGEDRKRAPVIGEVDDAQAVVGHEQTQLGREIIQERPRFEFPLERPPDSGEEDEEIGAGPLSSVEGS
jgi:hypothetical protein